MKEKFKTTINAAIDAARKVTNKVEDAIETVTDGVAEVSETIDETIGEVADVAHEIEEVVETAPKIEDVMNAMVRDARVGHFIVDVLTGMDAAEASALHFPKNDVEEQSVDVDALVVEAERRGYMRGRNEQIEVKMREPSQWQSPVDGGGNPGREEAMILSNRRRSVWE